MSSINPKEFCKKVLYTEEQIEKRCKELGKQISSDYAGRQVTFISILNGAFMFTGSLLKNVEAECRIDFMQVSTYGASTTTSGDFIVKKDLSLDIKDKDVIIIEDILDTGFTLYNLINYLNKFNPNSIKICTLIDKPLRRVNDIEADYVGFTMDTDMFIVGCGLDFAQEYRNLPYICVLNESIYLK
jgi:hypoxanthine phosphoribosyltransferase